MNKDFKKAMENTHTHFTVGDWWKRNSYKFWRILLFPVWLTELLYSKYKSWADARQTWSDERTEKILQYYVPSYSEWSEKDKTFYFFDNGMGWGYNTRFIKRKDRRYWKKYCGWWGYEIRRYLIDNFELVGFTKEIGYCDNCRTDISFTLKDE